MFFSDICANLGSSSIFKEHVPAEVYRLERFYGTQCLEEKKEQFWIKSVVTQVDIFYVWFLLEINADLFNRLEVKADTD